MASAAKGDQAKMSNLVLDAAKQVWNIAIRLQDSPLARRLLIKPVFATLFYLSHNKIKQEADLLVLLTQLLFKACLESQDYELAENRPS